MNAAVKNGGNQNEKLFHGNGRIGGRLPGRAVLLGAQGRGEGPLECCPGQAEGKVAEMNMPLVVCTAAALICVFLGENRKRKYK